MAKNELSADHHAMPKPIKREKMIQTLKYLLLSGGGGVIQIGIFTLLNEATNWPYGLCYILALTLAVLFDLTANRRLIFMSAARASVAMRKILCYYLVFAPLSTWLGNVLVAQRWNAYLVLFGTMLINFIIEFFFWRFVVFGKTIAKKMSKTA